VHLTEAEAELLFQLARRAGEPVSREALAPQGDEAGDSRLIDVQMTRLRRKIEDDPRYPRFLVTVRGRGYMLQPD
jgi:two-component system phosphate regulon response regulator OmpR